MRLIILLLIILVPFFSLAQGSRDTTSFIQTVDVVTGKIDTIVSLSGRYEAPNWHPGNYLILNKNGMIWKLDLATKKLSIINTGFALDCNNDHGFTPDKQWLIISHNDRKDTSSKSYKSAIYKAPVTGGTPIRITAEVPSYWHGCNPDGKSLVYCAERGGNYDVYSIGINGGQEKRLTDSPGLDDGPEYSPDGKYIYFNSYRTGHMQLWRMAADGSGAEQLTSDENSNWFAHPSPDSRALVFIAYTSDQKQEHLFGKDVKLRLMDPATKAIKDLTPVFFGGQGTINVPSWSPDSRKVAFVSYVVK